MTFDYRTKIINSKGKTLIEQPYNLKIDGGVHKMERPPGSGVWYDPSGELTPESAEKMNKQADKSMEEIVKELEEKTQEEKQKDPKSAAQHAADVANGHEAAKKGENLAKLQEQEASIANGHSADPAKVELEKKATTAAAKKADLDKASK